MPQIQIFSQPYIGITLAYSRGQLPSSDRNLPSSDRNLPSSDRNLPSSDRNLPSSDRNLPSSDRNLPSSDRNLPSSDRNLHLKVTVRARQLASVAQLVRALHRNRWSIPVRGPIVVFFATAPG